MAHAAWWLPLRLPPPGALDGQCGQGQEELEREVLGLDEPMDTVSQKRAAKQ